MLHFSKCLTIWFGLSFIGNLLQPQQPVDIAKVNLKLTQDDIAITFFDLSSGEATLIQNAKGNTILINCGGPKTQSEMEMMFQLYDIKQLDTVIITKDDIQYDTNIDWIIQNFPVGKIVLASNNEHPYPFLDDIKIEKWKNQDSFELFNHVVIKVENENIGQTDGALDLSIFLKSHHILYMTNAGKLIEKKLLTHMETEVDILKVGDFGAEGGTTSFFLEKIDPKVAIIFQNKNNKPNQEVLERLYDSWIDIYLTKQVGNISIKYSNDQYEIIPIEVNKQE